MNAELFKKWFVEQLLPNLDKPSIIIMDNASYHSKLIEKIPNKSWKKDDIKNFLIKHNLEFEEDMLKAALLRIALQANVIKTFEIDELALQWGHKVLRLPPYHCQFNPIELVWARCKEFYNKNIGSDGFGDEKVLDLWKKSLLLVDKEAWMKCIGHAENAMSVWWDVQKKWGDHVQEPIVIHVDSNSDSSSNELQSDSDD